MTSFFRHRIRTFEFQTPEQRVSSVPQIGVSSWGQRTQSHVQERKFCSIGHTKSSPRVRSPPEKVKCMMLKMYSKCQPIGYIFIYIYFDLCNIFTGPGCWMVGTFLSKCQPPTWNNLQHRLCAGFLKESTTIS